MATGNPILLADEPAGALDFHHARLGPPTTIGIAAVAGIASVAATPLLLARWLRRMNLPGTFRVVE